MTVEDAAAAARLLAAIKVGNWSYRADHDVNDEDVPGDEVECVLCDARWTGGEWTADRSGFEPRQAGPEEHKPDCPWAQAVRWMASQ